MARQLTEQQQKFLSVLFEEAGGDVLTAKNLQGIQIQLLQHTL